MIWSSRLPKPPGGTAIPDPHANPVFGVGSGLLCRRRRLTGAERQAARLSAIADGASIMRSVFPFPQIAAGDLDIGVIG
jgi:hypothetical protein